MARPTTMVLAGLLAAGLPVACEAETAAPPGVPLCAPTVKASADGGVSVTPGCVFGPYTLHLRIKLDGAWIDTDTCEDAALTVRCSMALGAGTLVVAIDPATGWQVPRFEPARAGVFGGFELSATVDLGGATAWLSNGFHSWSQSGALALGAAQPDRVAEDAVAERGDVEVLRTGETHSWWHTWVGGGSRALVAGVLRARRFRSWATIGRVAGGVRVRLVTGGVAADEVTAAVGTPIEGEPWYVALGDPLTLNELLHAYGSSLPSRLEAAYATREAGWNSWYELWDGVDEAAVRANAVLARDLLAPHLPEGAAPLRIVIDDGWQEAWGDWRPNAKFPSGLAGLAADLRADGFTVGVWLAPLLVDLKSSVATDHPDWLVGGATYNHPSHGTMGVLDVTHPAALAHLKGVISGLVADGLDLLKIDFLFAGTYGGERAAPVTGMEAFRLALEAIREAAGEDTVLLAVGAPGVPVLPWVDAWRVGGDIALEPFGAAWAWLPNQARSVAARWPLCVAVLCDADPALLRTLPQGQVEAGAWIVALAGGGFFLSDDLRTLDAERPAWGLSDEVLHSALSGRVASPRDLVPDAPPADLANAIGDFAAGETHHVVPGLWEAYGATVRLNTSDAPRALDGVIVPARSVVTAP